MKKLIFLFIGLIGLISNSYASHLMGADIVYECLGPGQYRVTMALYRDCNGITAASSQVLNYSSSSCGASGSITLSQVGSPVDITPICPGEPTACNGNGQWGVQRYIYQGILNLPAGCGNDWVLGWSQCCRNGAVNTLSSSSSQNMYVGAHLDNTATPCNSSPVFNNPPGSIVCVNQPVVYNHGVSDADGDSLYFSLGNCYEGNGNSVNYSGSYSGTNPLSTSSGITVNPNTGAISFTPNQQQVGVLCINVKEYRNGVLIGEINRDMQFTVINCSNQPPSLTGINGSPNTDPLNFETSICANGTLCFNVNGSDPNASDNINMSWNNEIPTGNFTVTNNNTANPVGQFCWTPSNGDIGTHFFTVNVQDDACPVVGAGTYTYTIEVLPSPNTLSVSPNDTICFGESTTLTATSTPTATSYTWSPATGLSSTSGASVVASPVTSTNYQVTASFPDGCDLTDVVTVGVAPNPNVSVTPANSFNCSGQPTDLSATYSSSYSYNWSPGAFPNSADITVNATSTTTYTVEVTESNFGCTSTATATVVVAAPTSNACNVLYVTPSGIASNDGTKASPLDLVTAMEIGACNGTTIKMAVGDYVTDSTINRVTSYLTLEGGFNDATPNWDKISTAGATRILRTATRSTSTTTTSIVQGSGIPNEFGPNPEVVAIEVSNQTGFRFQDITVRSQLTNPNTEFQGEPGVDVIGVRLNACDQYNLVRTQINTSQAGKGGNQDWSIPAEDGGDARGLVALSNGVGTNLIQCNITAGAAGAGGNSNTNGSPASSAGSPGTTQAIQRTGTAFVTNQNLFDLVGQPTISMDDIACTATNMDFRQTTTSGSWTFGAGSSPSSATGSTVTTAYSTLGRKDIGYVAGNNYLGFANILLDSQVLPAFTTSAPIINGAYRICAGEDVNFSATNGGTGYIYHWDLGGGATPNNYDGVAYETLQDIDFMTPGIYTIELRYETSCCGLSIPTTLELHVEDRPIIAMPADATLCAGSTTGVTLTVGGMLPNGTINWAPSSGLDVNDSPTVVSLPSDTTTYNVTMVDSSGLCSNAGYVTVNVVNLDLATSSTDASCGPNGSASVTTTGGSGTYSYQWNDDANQTTATATGLAVGNYTVVVTDVATGCQDSAVATVNPTPASLVAYVSNTQGVSCYGSADGRLTVSVNGGTAPFDYVWDNGSSTLNTSSTSDSIVNLVGGTYEVTVTDNNGCTYTVSALVPEPDSLMSAIDSVMNPTCLGATDGYLRVFIDGGAAPHSILWDDPSASTTNEVFNLGVGTYCVTTTDANGCIDSACFTLTAPQLQSTVNDTICYNDNYTLPDGTIVSPSADTVSVDTIASSITGCDSIVTTNLVVNPLPTISINVSPNDTVCEGSSVTLTASGSSTTGYTWTPTIQNGVAFTPAVGATQYVVSTTDVNTCQNSDSITIVVNPLPSVVANASDIEICAGDSIYLFGTGTDIYTWDNGYQDSVYFVPAVGTHDYYVTGTDTSTGCTNRDTVTVTVNPTPNVTANTSDNNVCFGTQITLTGGGADTYSWNPTVQNGTAFTPSVGSTVYTVRGTDVNGCQDSASLTIVVNPLPTVVANAAPNDTICEINDVTLFGSGNADNYSWTNGVLDGNPFSQNVGTQDYIVTGVITATNCQSADTISITVLSQPQVDVNITPNDTLCEGTAVTLTASGATTYTWDNNNVENGVAFTQNVGFTTYTVIGNTQGCEDTVSVSVLINPTPSIDATATPDSIYPGDQSILEAIGSGSFVWDGVQNGSTYTVSPLDETTYSVQITDANGCVNETTITVYVLGLTQDQLMIPDAFSPNNDNINDIFRVVTSQYFPEIEMRVYNRWGEMVHSEVGQTNHGWDGKFKGEDQPVDAYSYIVRVKTLDDQEFIVSGTVSLFR